MVTLHYSGQQLRIQRCSYYTRDLIHLTFTWEESKEIRKPNSEFIHMSRSFWLNIFKLNLWREAWVWVLFCELVVELSKVGHHRKFVRTKKRTFQEISMFFWTLVKKVSTLVQPMEEKNVWIYTFFSKCFILLKMVVCNEREQMSQNGFW